MKIFSILIRKNFRIYIWIYRILVNNGLVFYATWVTIATILNFNIALEYDSKGNLILKNNLTFFIQDFFNIF
jgi:hypothetical protein